MKSIRLLLDSAIDYAGLFPPAGLGMAEAVREYASCRTGESSWALGRFTVPVSRFAELESCIDGFKPRPEYGKWRLSALGGPDPERDSDQVFQFGRLHPEIQIEAIELKASGVEEIRSALRIFSGRLEVFLEIPVEADDLMLQAILQGGGHAKVRTGGIRADMFPSPAQLAGFVAACAKSGLRFKATAGLHHAIRSVHPLTYEPSSPSGMMHGFLNLLIASAFSYTVDDRRLIEAILEEQKIEAFAFGKEGVSWRGRQIGNQQLRETREQLFLSFGSCSFREPLSDLEALRLL